MGNEDLYTMYMLQLDNLIEQDSVLNKRSSDLNEDIYTLFDEKTRILNEMMKISQKLNELVL